MKEIFNRIFLKQPQKEDDGIYFFGGESDGDCFDEQDFNIWQNGRFYKNWRSAYLSDHPASFHLINQILKDSGYVIDLACGAGMGFIPSLKNRNASFPCMASDANPNVLREWKNWLKDNEKCEIDFAQFSIFDIPFKDNSVQAYSSFIGISNTRDGEKGYSRALSEIHRTLAKDGALYAIENEWEDVGKILDLFKKMNARPWECFCEKQKTWRERFTENGFEIIFEQPLEIRRLTADDNELGAAAGKFGIEINLKYTAFIVRKKDR